MMNINTVEVIGMLENIDELLRIYEVMKKDLYTLLVTKSPYILDYEGSNDRGKTITKLVEFRYRTNFKDSDHILTFKVQRYLKEALKHDIMLWGETQQIESLYVLVPCERTSEEDFRMTVLLNPAE